MVPATGLRVSALSWSSFLHTIVSSLETNRYFISTETSRVLSLTFPPITTFTFFHWLNFTVSAAIWSSAAPVSSSSLLHIKLSGFVMPHNLRFCKHLHLSAKFWCLQHTVIIRLSPPPPGGGLIQNSTFKSRGLFERGRLFKGKLSWGGGLTRETYYVSREAEFSPKKLSKS